MGIHGSGYEPGLRQVRALVGTIFVGLLLASCSRSGASRLSDDGANWVGYGRDPQETHFSPLTEINDGNVARLGLVWSMDLPTLISSHSAPLAIDGVLYFAVGLSNVYAVDAATGKQLWHYDPDVPSVAGGKLRLAWGIRGIAYWDGKIYTGTQDGRLIAIDARTGAPVWSVRTLDLGNAMYITGAPRMFNGKVIIGNGGAEYGDTRGYVTAYDAKTGRQVWRFYTVPGNPANGFENKAMEMAAKTWKGEWWKYGGGGTAWNAITYDPELNRIYIGTGNGTPWNQKIRSPGGGDNLFLCSIVALDADTGEYIWHYQVNPGETWDYNAAMDIELATLKIDGKDRRVIMHAPKNGFFYVIDRDTGKLISAEPIAKVNWASRIDIKTGRPVENPDARYPDGETTIWPGQGGAHSWEAMAFSPRTGLAYIPTVHLPSYINDKGIDFAHWKRRPGMALDGGINPPDFEIPPPDGTKLGSLQAWNPVTQKRVWEVPQLGAFNGGAMATGGNLVFQGQADGRFVARAADSGKELWSFDAQNGILAQPISYSVKGKQYVTVITGYAAVPGMMGALSSQFGWDYRNQKRRVLTFMLNGKASLPPREKPQRLEIALDASETIDPVKVKVGKELYNVHCVLCHGPAAVAGGTAPDLRASQVPLSPDSFYQVVHDGAFQSQAMPNFDHLTAGQVESLRHFIRHQAQKASTGRSAGSAGG